MDERRLADYFVVAGLPPDPVPLEEFSNESVLKPTHRQDPIVDLAIINRSLGEETPPQFRCIEFTPTGHPADLNHGSIRAPEMYMCFRRGRDKPPLVDIGVLYEGKERVLPGCEVIYLTPHGRSANINNSGNTRIYVTYRRADPKAASDTLSVMDICVILTNKNEDPPHTFCQINKTLNKGMMGSDVYLCYKKSMAKTNFITYKPAVLSRYPLDNLPGFDLPDRVAMFCLPLGAVIESWPADARRPSPVFSTFVLTAAAADGERVYGAAVTFYESLDPSSLNDVQRQQLMLDSSAAAADAKSSSGTPQKRVVAQNKSICVLSRLPFFSTFKQFLVYLYKMSLPSSPPHPAPIERYIAHFLNEVPCPSQQRPRILIQLDTNIASTISVCQPDETPMPRSGAKFSEMLKNLGPSNCVSLLLYTLLEQKLLIHSLRPAVLTSVAEAISNMIFPFHWQCPYIPLCPLSLSYVLNSPTPFIVGIDSRYFDLYDPPHDVTCIDLDTNTLSVPYDDKKGHSIKMIHLPKKATKVLKTTLDRLFEQLCQETAVSAAGGDLWLDSSPIDPDLKTWKRELQMETAIQEAFLRFMAAILKNYNNYLLPITKAPTLGTTDVSSLFDIQGFLKSRDKAYIKFYGHLMKMQSFSRFIEERSFVSDKDSGLAFFDECMEKVDEMKDEPRLIELEDSLKSERTAFVMPPEPVDLPPGAQYRYNFFPELDLELFPNVGSSPLLSVGKSPNVLFPGGSQTCPYSPMTKRTKLEIKSAQKMAARHVNFPSMWPKCLLWHCYSMWFIYLPTYVMSVPSKTKSLRAAFDVLVRMQAVKLQPPDEVCYRVLMQLCGQYHQPILAVKVLFEMRRQGVQPNAITYGFYNKAVLESKWPSGSSATGYQLWMKLRNVVQAVAQFRTGLGEHHQRRQSVYSNSETESYTDDVQSVDSFVDSTASDGMMGGSLVKPSNSMILIESNLRKTAGSGGTKATNTNGHSVAENNKCAPSDMCSTGGMSDRGYNSMTLEDANRISMVIGSVDSLDSGSQPQATDGTVVEERPGVEGNSKVGVDPEPEPVVSEDKQNVDSANVACCEEATDLTTASCNGTVTAECDNNCTVADNCNSKENSIPATDEQNVNDVDSSTAAVEDCTTPICPHPESDSGSVSSFKLQAGSPVSSPVHSVRTVVTSDDPLGLFNEPIAVTIKSTEVKPTATVAGSLQNAKDRANSMATIALSAEVNALDKSLRKSNSLDRLLSTESSHRSSSMNDVDGNDQASQEAANKLARLEHRPVSASPRMTASFGGTFRSAASLFATKYREIRQSVVPVRTASTAANDSDAVNCEDQQQQQNGGGGGSATSVEAINDSVSVASDSGTPDSLANVSAVPESPGGASSTPPAVAAKSRLKVTQTLYSPLVSSVLGGIKSLQNNERLLGIKSSIESVTMSMRDTLVESWGITDDDDIDVDGETDETAGSSGDQTVVEKDGCDGGEQQDRNVKEECQKIDSDTSSFELNNDEASPGNLLSVPSAPHSSRAAPESVLEPIEDRLQRDASGDSSVQNIPQLCSCGASSSASKTMLFPIEVELCSLSRCQSCENLLYDEEIMAGWTADDSNFNTSCQFCGSKLVPFLVVFIKDYRHVVRPMLTSLSQSTESMLSVQSTIGLQSPAVTNQQMSCDGPFLPSGSSAMTKATTAPSCDSGVETGGVGEIQEVSSLDTTCVVVDDVPDVEAGRETNDTEVADGKCDKAFVSVVVELTAEQSVSSGQLSQVGSCPPPPSSTDQVAVDKAAAEMCSTKTLSAVGSSSNRMNDKHAQYLNRRLWGSTDVLRNVGAVSYGTDDDRKNELRNGLPNCGRRWTSEYSLNSADVRELAGTVQINNATENKVDDGSSIVSNGSDSKSGYSSQKCILLEPVGVPYLSPLVLRKELENVFDQDGDMCLGQPDFIDQHPIVYWNLLWYFHRLNVPSHLPGFVMTSKFVNKNVAPSPIWSVNDSRLVGIHCKWDNVDMHSSHGQPMYLAWNQCNVHSTPTMYPATSKSVMQSILSSIKANDVVSPLRLLLNERAKHRADYGRTRFHSIYRDILFLSFAALGRDCIDHDAFDREFKSMYEELPPQEKARMRVADRAPNTTAVAFRRLFGDLEL